jgi:hypothetical protein
MPHAKSSKRKFFSELVAELASPEGDWKTPKPCQVHAGPGQQIAVSPEIAEQLTKWTLRDWLSASCDYLWNCTDQLPRNVANDIDVILGAEHPVVAELWSGSSKRTYASAARALKRIINQRNAA